MNFINGIIIGVIGIAIAVVVFLVGSTYVRNTSISECLKAAQLVTERENGSRLTEPDRFWYDFCMGEKGLK